ncbi:transposase [Streptomyces griseocarneus]|nr:transposase [Streptomyces griseocarneus]
MSQFYGIAGTGSTSATPPCDCLAHRFGNAGDHGVRERRYPTDISAERPAAATPFLIRLSGLLRSGARLLAFAPLQRADDDRFG